MSKTVLSGTRALFCGLAASVALSACTSTVGYLPREGATRISLPQARMMSQEHADMENCTRLQSTYDAAGWPKGTDLETVSKIDALVRKRFVYTREKEDVWDSRADIMLLTDHRWAGDCDDLAATVVALSRCAGVPSNRLGFLMVKGNGAAVPNHMIGFYTDVHGASYGIGDTFAKTTRPLLAFGQVPYAWSFLDDVNKWFRVDDGEAFSDPRLVWISLAEGEL